MNTFAQVRAPAMPELCLFDFDGAITVIRASWSSMILDAGHAVRFRYRVIIHTGDSQSAKIASEYEKFSR